MCSSLPRHGARIRIKTQSTTERRKKKEKKKKPSADCKGVGIIDVAREV